MMRLVSDTVASILNDFEVANNAPFQGDIYPLVGGASATRPFCLYAIQKQPQFSKEMIHDVTVTLKVVHDNYEALCDLTDQLEAHFTNYPDFHYQNTNPGVNPDDMDELFMDIQFNVKMIK